MPKERKKHRQENRIIMEGHENWKNKDNLVHEITSEKKKNVKGKKR